MSTLHDFIHSINYLHVFITLGIPLIGAVCAIWVPLTTKTFLLSCAYWFLTGMGITGGYHRLWAHRTYSAHRVLQVSLALLGAGAVQGSIKRWVRDHRAHHRYVDTDKDPYNVRRGFMHAHMGWIIFKQDHTKIGRADISDLKSDPVVQWQHTNYPLLLVTMAFVAPTVVAGLGWGDWRGGFTYAGILRMFVIQQNAYCINSLAHWLGDQPYQSTNSPRDNFLAAILTLGEGYHNFHHEFPNDYRNGVRMSDWDPTKWFLNVLLAAGLAYDARKFPDNEITKGRYQEQLKDLQKLSGKIDWGIAEDQLPTMTMQEFQKASSTGARLVCMDDIVYDVGDFISEHPGGEIIKSAIGKDMADLFNGGVYNHSNGARNLLSQMRKARLEG